ncbi:DUF4238 domain-containing protein [Pseudomonas fluorescens]|uniref:DUF4238 domain-containing protein n=1 Tax=Pseudomonas fluorescens TaxID=294 RepID=A0A423LT36_PSEFL|nr:DUF4238 domain-containing protein [Pseudomonas fluorescens]RON71487.1 hypothetical protein BK671_04810 [Pseudomonas fluorescens]
MNEPKKHHFSPVFYLSGWCDSTSGKLIAYSRSHKGVVAKPVYPKATGYEYFLYTMEGLPDGRKQIIEKDYMASKVDDPAAKVLKVLLDSGTSALTVQQRGDWTRFIVASLYRRPAAVAEIGETFKSALPKDVVSDSPNESDQQELPAYLVNDAAKEMVVRVIENDGMGIIINMQWSVLDMSASQHELLTGDMPHLRYYGLKDPRCTILFPLTPTKLFIATHDRKSEHTINQRSKTEIVKSVNDELARLAERFVFGRTTDHLKFVGNRLVRTPSR